MHDDAINTLAAFVGVRDIPTLTQAALQDRYQIDQVDVMVLFGGSILAGGDVLAAAMHHRVARHYLIVGGAGHTTETLRQIVHALYPELDVAGQPEAVIFDAYLKAKYDLHVDALETESTNCGNNITCMLALLHDRFPEWQSIILAQDATMQRRMMAGLKKYVDDKLIIGYATYQVAVQNATIVEPPLGMWPLERYVTLLMGEIPRFKDYGPKGQNFIADVAVPSEVTAAFEILKQAGVGQVRAANPAFAAPPKKPEA